MIQKPQDWEFTMQNSDLEDLEHTELMQYSVEKGIQVFGSSVYYADLHELNQLHIW